ncbi:hypothetical protein CY34DRAFT_479418 [Suillus luteus UH-Slu-Lm8-n1]|uniref:Uncharacterized protein n=1 Tax=Suillus luteus UH-Slu-Lm8-n1 TaxID=930992 RepID=A0A0D0AS32_9AGAM|nr:hypothetical protein CY34DRAFT_479418 [Suillus luteus UH-Slu-Lm8-n1]
MNVDRIALLESSFYYIRSMGERHRLVQLLCSVQFALWGATAYPFDQPIVVLGHLWCHLASVRLHVWVDSSIVFSAYRDCLVAILRLTTASASYGWVSSFKISISINRPPEVSLPSLLIYTSAVTLQLGTGLR